MVTDKDEMIVTTSILNFMLQGPKSAAAVDENDDGELTLVCRAYNPAIKTSDRHYVETKVTLDVQCKYRYFIFQNTSRQNMNHKNLFEINIYA